MHAVKILAFVSALFAVAMATSGANAQQGNAPDSGSMMGHQPDSGSMMGDQSEGGSMMGDQSKGGSMMGQGMMGGSMGQHGMMSGMGGKRGDASMCAMMTGHVEGRLAYLKAELKITPEQDALWNDYASAVRGNAQSLSSRCGSMMGKSGATEPSLLERLDAHEQFLAARLDALRATSKALKPLYAALSDAQKEVANQLIRSSMGMM